MTTKGNGLKAVGQQLMATRNILLVLLTPIVLLPIIFEIGSTEAKCAYVVIIMGVYWCTEALPISVTSLLPVLLFPTTGVLEAKEISKAYVNDTSMMFIGGLVIAVAVERWNLHKRIALSMLMLVGSEPRWLMLGLMLPTWFLSMWISNTATTAMMIPIVVAVLDQLKGSKDNKVDGTESNGISTTDIELRIEPKGDVDVVEKPADATPENRSNYEDDVSYKKMCKGLSIAIAYAANCGGIGSLTGTGPNLVLKGQSDQYYTDVGLTSPITFTSWMVFCFPISLLMVIFVWLWLQVFFLGVRCQKQDAETSAAVKRVIRKAYRDLGPVSFAEGAVLAHFALLLVLWITRDVGGSGGWGTLFPEGFVSDSTPATLVATLLFIFPSDFKLLFAGLSGRGVKSVFKPLLVWNDVHEKLPWGVVLLLGGGFALAKACDKSGLSHWLGTQLTVLSSLPAWAIMLIVCYITAATTEVTSNTATATLLMPIMKQLAIALGKGPLYLMWPSAIVASFAFMLPAATPPNAIVFSSGHVRVIDMVKAGCLLNIIGVPIVVMATHAWGNAYFDFDYLPPEFLVNSTLSTTPSVLCSTIAG